MRICVVGAGAIGATIGARLAAAGHEVRLVARGAHLAAIQANGLRFIDRVGAHTGVYRLAASADARDFGPQDYVFLAVKAHQIAAILPSLDALLAPGTLVIPAINGLPWWYFQGVGGRFEGLSLQCLDPDGQLSRQLPIGNVIGCVVHMAGEIHGPGEVRCTAGRRLIVGEPLHSGADSERLAALAAMLEGAGFAVERSADIRRDVWVKLIGNLSFNPVAALTGYRMDQICADDGILEVIRAMLREGAAVAAEVGVDVGITPDERIAIARQLGAARISMLQDFESGRSPELAPIVGAVIELAQRAGVDVPAIRAVHALVQARARALGLIPF
jgi:2-dehydropantoate 2-reductase